MSSLRKYLLQTELGEYIKTSKTFDENTLIQAEIDIDTAIGIFLEGYKQPFLSYKITKESKDVFLYSTYMDITNETVSNGFYDYTVVKLLSGANKGLEIPIESSTCTNNITRLTYFDAQTGLTGSTDILIWQIGKFPTMGDTESISSTYYKAIPTDIKRCVALQYAYRLKNKGKQTGKVSSYSVSGTSYSESFDNSKPNSPKDYLDSQVYDFLSSKGYLSAY